MGFPYYDIQPAPEPKTVAELIAELSGPQRGQILKGYTMSVDPEVLARRMKIEEVTVDRLHSEIDQMVAISTDLMREEHVVTPQQIDPQTGEVTQPAVYNDPITGPADLLARVSAMFSDNFTGAQVEAILTKMVEFSKRNGSGDWNFYSTEVRK